MMERHWRYFLILVWIGFILGGGIHLFSKGFLLTRMTENSYSACKHFKHYNCENNIQCNETTKLKHILNNVNASADICLPKKSKIILLVIDALKYEFGEYNPDLIDPLPYQNKLPILHDLLTQQSRKSKMMKFIADPPTTTLQRLKGLTTGSLPTFIDIGSNFATPEINEDNIIDQITRNNLTSIFMGDSTWIELFPKRFKRQYSFPSFNIFDLDSVDREIEKILPKELENNDWDVLIAHFLGVDHCGHKYGPLHEEMTRKLTEMDTVIRNIVKKMDDDTTLIVFGDHGMTTTGDHGGDSDDEVTTLLFAYSKGYDLIPSVKDDNIMQQIDLVPTLAVILGTPIPYSNLGTINTNLLPDFHLANLPRHQTLLLHMWQNAIQLQQYFQNYATNNKGTFSLSDTDDLGNKFLILSHRVNTIYTEAAFQNFAKDLRLHLKSILDACRNIWVKFDPQLMSQGILITFMAIFMQFLLIQNLKINQLDKVFTIEIVAFIYFTNAFIAGGLFISRNFLRLNFGNEQQSIILIMCIYNIFLLVFFTIQNWDNITENWHETNRISDLMVRLIYFIGAIVFFSNSFIVQEQKILCYLLMGMIIYQLQQIKVVLNTGQRDKRKFKLSSIFTSLFARLVLLGLAGIILLRFSHYYFRCREEQGNCTDFLTYTTTKSFDYLKSAKFFRLGSPCKKFDIIAILVLALFATVSRIYLRSCGNLSGLEMNILLARYGPTVAAICTGGHFMLSQNPTPGVHQIHIDALAWVVYLLFLIQLLILLHKPLMTYLVPREKDYVSLYGYDNVIPELYKKLKNIYHQEKTREDPNIPIICGLATVYSSVYVSYSVLLTILLALLLGVKASTGLFVVLSVTGIICVLAAVLRYETTNTLEMCLQPKFSTLVSWMLIIHFCFFATSHQPTMSQIDWHAAFVGRTANHDHSNIISAILVLMNTFNGVFLFGTIYPLMVLCPFFVYAIMPSYANQMMSKQEKEASQKQHQRDLKKTSDNIEYRTVTVSQAEESLDGVTYDITRGELNLFENDSLFVGAVFKTGCQLFMLQGLRIFCSMLACTIHCRHLMVWKIFAPRFIYEGIATYFLILSIIVGYFFLIRIHKSVTALVTKLTKSR